MSTNQTALRTLKVAGMTCGHCVSRVTRALAGIPDLVVANVQMGSVRFTSSAKAAVEEAVDALATLGYTAQVVDPEFEASKGGCGTCSCCR